MLLRNLGLLTTDPAQFLALTVTVFLALLVGITVHEFSHALVAYHLGDRTAQRQGRLSLNPLRHLDPTGTLMLILAGFGWGKPVPVDPRFLRGSPRTGMSLVSFAGPLANIVTAFLVGILFRVGLVTPSDLASPTLLASASALLAYLAFLVIFFNLILAVFNLLPIWPLDGFKVVLGVLPAEPARGFARLQPYGPVLLLGIIFADILFRLGILWAILGPPIDLLLALVVG